MRHVVVHQVFVEAVLDFQPSSLAIMYVLVLVTCSSCAEEHAAHAVDDAIEPVVQTTEPAVETTSQGEATGDAPIEETEAGTTEGTAEPRDQALIVDNALWEPADAAFDPFSEHRPPNVECLPTGAELEGEALQVHTDFCPYFAGWQPTLVDIVAGDELRIAAFHQYLAAEEPGEAHIAVVIDRHVVWEETIPVPNAPIPYNPVVLLDFDAPAGTPIHFHLHNHGYNDWKLLEIELLPTSNL